MLKNRRSSQVEFLYKPRADAAAAAEALFDVFAVCSRYPVEEVPVPVFRC